MKKSEQRGARTRVEAAIQDIRRGRMVVVLDDADRENEGDLVMAAEKVTPASVNFIITHARGLLCAPMGGAELERLGLGAMCAENTALAGTAFTVSVDARSEGMTTGISAADRARTLRLLASPRATPAQFARPGHIFPIRAEQGGVLARPGHTEAAVDLARLAGLRPVAVVCEIIAPGGGMARGPELRRFARRHGLTVITVRELIEYRRATEPGVTCVARTRIPTPWGDFQLHLYESHLDGSLHAAMVRGNVAGRGPALVRVHSQCFTGDVLHSLRCDCGEQRDEAMQRIAEAGCGVFLYACQEGRGIGLKNKLKAYELQDLGYDTVEANLKLGFPADMRDYGLAAEILSDLGVRHLHLLTNNPRKVRGLEAHGLRVERRVPSEVSPRPTNRRYLATKRRKLGHFLPQGVEVAPARRAARRGRSA